MKTNLYQTVKADLDKLERRLAKQGLCDIVELGYDISSPVPVRGELLISPEYSIVVRL